MTEERSLIYMKMPVKIKRYLAESMQLGKSCFKLQNVVILKSDIKLKGKTK